MLYNITRNCQPVILEEREFPFCLRSSTPLFLMTPLLPENVLNVIVDSAGGLVQKKEDAVHNANAIPQSPSDPSARVTALTPRSERIEGAEPAAEQATMGGDHGGGHGAGDFRHKVWSMTGGPYCRPVHWRRNTAIAMFGIFLVCIPIAVKSAELEVYTTLPAIPMLYFSPFLLYMVLRI
jgi:hypothetical protein